MTLSRLSKKCRKCPFVGKCEYKKMEAVACISEQITSDAAEESTQPILRETVNAVIDGEVVKVCKDEIEKELHKRLYSSLNLKTSYAASNIRRTFGIVGDRENE